MTGITDADLGHGYTGAYNRETLSCYWSGWLLERQASRENG